MFIELNKGNSLVFCTSKHQELDIWNLCHRETIYFWNYASVYIVLDSQLLDRPLNFGLEYFSIVALVTNASQSGWMDDSI